MGESNGLPKNKFAAKTVELFYGDGIFRSLDGGKTWDSNDQNSKLKVIRTFSPDSTEKRDILCGTEPGCGFRSADCGKTW